MNDISLVQSCLEGDVSSQRMLFQRYRGSLRRAIGRCGFDTADVAELEQRVWLRLLGPRRALESFTGQGSLDGWLRRVAFNEARSELRRRRRAPDDEPLDLARALGSGHDPERDAIKDEKRALMAEALSEVLASVDAADRDLLLAWAHGSTAEALARAQGVHRSSMSRRLDKLRKRTRARLHAALWEHYGRLSSELSVTRLDLRGLVS